MTVIARPGLERRLKAEGAGETLFDAFSRGRYATDASSYQMMPVGADEAPEVADDEDAAMGLRQWPPALDRGPAALLLAAAGEPRLQQQRADDEDEQHQVEDAAVREVPERDLLDLADDDAAHQQP